MGAADRRLRLYQSAGGARRGGPRHRALACRQAAVGHRWHAGRHQGHHRDRRHADRNGLAAVRRLALGERCRVRSGVARCRCRHHRQDGDDGIRRIRAARHAQSLEHSAHARRLVERLGGFRRRRHRQRRARHPGHQLDRSSASYCGTVGFKPTVNAINRQGSHDYQSQSCTGILGASLEDTWQVAYEIVARVGGDAGTPGLQGPGKAPAAKQPRALAMLETAGWDVASAGAKASLEDRVARLQSAGVDIRTRHNDKKVAALEAELPQVTELSHRCNGWENRWFLHTMRDRDASKLSRLFVERAEKYESLTLNQHRADLKERARIRAVHAELASLCDACITLAAPGAAPEGLGSTGNPEFGVPSSLLGVPSLSLPLFEVDAMPLGLQVIGYFDRDADAFAIASWLMQAH